jgi:microcin C transport system substrate-binding protein
VVSPWARNLEKIGVKLNFRTADFSLYQQRLQKFDFDMVSLAYGGTNNPGQEFVDLFGSKAADQEDSGNHSGIKNAAVDALINQMVSARSKAELLPACRALERVIAHSHILVPQWSASTHRMVFNALHLARPGAMPPYAAGENWAMDTWWAR